MYGFCENSDNAYDSVFKYQLDIKFDNITPQNCNFANEKNFKNSWRHSKHFD